MNDDANPADDGGAKDTRKPLTKTFVGNFLWTISGAAMEAVLKIVVLSILARLLAPGDFGVVSAAITVVALAEIFGRVGVAPSIIQRPDLSNDDIRTGFTLAVLSGLVVAALFFVFAGVVADYYGMPDLTDLVRAFSLLFILRGFTMVSEALLQRRMQFRKLALANLLSYLIGYAATAITLSNLGFGPWALVWGQMAQVAVMGVIANGMVRHDMRPMLHPQSFRHFLHFGGGATLTGLGNYVALNADYFVVGRWLGADALGYYSRAYLLLWQPAQLFGSMGDRVLFPALASIQHERARVGRAFCLAIGLTSFFLFPVSALLIVLAPEIIRILLGQQWGAAVVPFQILVTALTFRTAYKFIGTVLRATGAEFTYAAWQWTYALCIILSAFAGKAYGLAGVSVAVALSITLIYLLGVVIVRWRARISVLNSVIALGRYLALGLALCGLLFSVKALLLPLGLPALAIVAIICSVALLAGVIAFWLLPILFGDERAWLIESMLMPLARRVGIARIFTKEPQ